MGKLDSKYHRYKIRLSYDGTHFSGWQVQPGRRTVQGELENALRTIFQTDIQVVGCGRTDAGVHAENYIAHVDLPNFEHIDLIYKLNSMLDWDLSVHAISQTDASFHARFSATNRSYTYHVHGEKNPFLNHYSWYYPSLQKLDHSKISQISEDLSNFEDFTSFCKTKSSAHHMICKQFSCSWDYNAKSQKAELRVEANRFLRGMVRLITGMCINIGNGLLERDEVLQSIKNKNRLKLNYSAPAHGLILKKVSYN
jgi:tRNA pseudouridine38-40 synthase